MPLLAMDSRGEAARNGWLIRLRWVAVAGVLAVVTVSGPVLGIVSGSVPYAALFGITALLGAWNLMLEVRLRHGRPIPPPSRQVVVDLLALGGLLAFSGGLRNPFSIFLAVHVILGAILLSRVKARRMGLLGGSIVLLLAGLDLAGRLPAALQGTMSADRSAIWGAALALLITLAVALYFTINIMEDLRAAARREQRSHEQVEEERRNLRNLVRSMGAGLLVLDRDLRLLWRNANAEKMLTGLALGKTPPMDLKWLSMEALADGRSAAQEWRARDANGRQRRYEISAAPIRRSEGGLDQVILLLMDVTEHRAALEQLQMTERLAALGRLAAGLAHEIATPLGSVGILGSEARAALPRCWEPEVQRQVDEYLQDIDHEVRRISKLVRRLLDLSHPEEDDEDEVLLADLVRDAVHLVSVGGSQRFLEVEESPSLPPVRTSRDRLLQVLLNVLDNALDAVRATGGSVRVRIQASGGRQMIEITDDGPGISKENLPRIFDPFFTTKDVGEGTGLGLYVSYEIMKNMGGSIEITSPPGEGTCVRLSLPGEQSRTREEAVAP